MPEQKFVGRFERAIMQYAILDIAKDHEVTRENLRQTFTGKMQMGEAHLDECLTQLVNENHLTREDNKFRITDDGREDVQQVETFLLQAANLARGGREPATGTATPMGREQAR